MKKWKKIPNYSTYEASTDGEIKTFNWRGSGREAIMKPARDNGGYLRTMLKHDNGKISTIKVHRIIAMTFLDNPENKETINHKNGIKTDNRVINLEWSSRSENCKHAFDTNLNSNKGQNNPASSLTDKEVIEIRNNYQYGRKSRHDGGFTKKQIADKYNTTFATIKQIIQGKSWKHLL